LLAGAVVLAVSAGLVGSQIGTSAERGSLGAPPPLTRITAPIQFAVLQVTVPVRADVVDAAPISVALPDDLGTALPVVTRSDISPGSTVSEGQWLVGIAERPVIALSGAIPAFRDMTPGESGVDVEELQSALHRLGFGTGDDLAGAYGNGTEQAVRRWYANAGFVPAVGPLGAIVPRGEVLFCPTLPARVLSVSVGLGAAVPAGGSVAEIGSGAIVLNASVDPLSVKSVQFGQSAVARSDLTGESFPVTVSSVSGLPSSDPKSGSQTYGVTMVPPSPVPPDVVGQNVGVDIATASSGSRTWIVPITAVITTASDRSYVTVLRPRERLVDVTVTPGLIAGGRQSVTPVSGTFHQGEQVLIGVKQP
jgi:peptidoglycan hydrolase-like protein with peptidoglycan-binding domain